MLEVIRAMYTFHQHIIYVQLHGIPDKVLEGLVYHALESGPGVLESERHHFVAVNFPIRGIGGLIFIWWVHLDLIIAE